MCQVRRRGHLSFNCPRTRQTCTADDAQEQMKPPESASRTYSRDLPRTSETSLTSRKKGVPKNIAFKSDDTIHHQEKERESMASKRTKSVGSKLLKTVRSRKHNTEMSSLMSRSTRLEMSKKQDTLSERNARTSSVNADSDRISRFSKILKKNRAQNRISINKTI